jgi:hypothetical protein
MKYKLTCLPQNIESSAAVIFREPHRNGNWATVTTV